MSWWPGQLCLMTTLREEEEKDLMNGGTNYCRWQKEGQCNKLGLSWSRQQDSLCHFDLQIPLCFPVLCWPDNSCPFLLNPFSFWFSNQSCCFLVASVDVLVKCVTFLSLTYIHLDWKQYSCSSLKTITSSHGQPHGDPLSLILLSPDKTPLKTSFSWIPI